jgi:ABC-type lipoprotein release transport system permease subunit
MLAVFAAAWRIIIKRTRADWLILAAAALIILLATTLLSAGPIYAGAVAISGLHRTLHDAPTTEGNVEISARIRPRDFEQFTQAVDDVAGNAFRLTGGTVARVGRSDSHALPDQPTDTVTNLTVFSFYDGLDQHATLVAGAWPQSGGERVETVVSDSTATLLGLQIGDELDMTNRRDEAFVAQVRITGIYQINDADDPYWWDETLEREGIEVGESFTTYGPFVVTTSDFFNRLTSLSSEVNWRVFPVFDQLTVDNVAPMRREVQALEDRLDDRVGGGNRFIVATRLDRILRDAERSLLVTRTGVMILTVQLAILAGYALVLTAGLLIEQRRVETALLQSRGASNEQVAAMALMEGLLLALPAAIVGPWLAAVSLRLLNVAGPLRAIDLTVDPVVTSGAYLLASISAAACVGALVLPAFLSARSFVEARAGRGRQQTRGIAQRAGIDLALLVVAGIGYWQLRRYGAPITESVQGRLGLDPLLVAAPALGLLAGAVVALRLIPLLARTVDRGVSSTRSLVPSLGAWQIARRPLRYARSALLLMLALAIGLFAISYTRTWTTSQRDQADFQVGADLRVTPDRRVGKALPIMNLAGAYSQLEGVDASLPVMRDLVQVSRSAGTAHLLTLDAATAGDVVTLRDDLADRSLDSMAADLVAARPTIHTIPVPGEPQRLAFIAQLTLDPPPDGVAADQFPQITPMFTVVLRDARGLLFRLDLDRIATDGAPQRLELLLAHELAGGAVAVPEYPIAIAAVEMRSLIPIEVEREGTLELLGVEASASTTGSDWSPVPLDSGSAGWAYETGAFSGAFTAPAISGAPPPPGGLAFRFNTGSVSGQTLLPSTFRAGPANALPEEPITVLVSNAFLAATESAVGDTIGLDLSGNRYDVRIVGAFERFPTVRPTDEIVIVADLPTVATLNFVDSGRVEQAEEWWLAVEDGRSDEIVATLHAPPYSSWRVDDRFERAQTLRTDPVALGIIGALSLGFVAAALFASIGFIVSAAVSARERMTEFALLRALGLSPQQLSGWLSLENGILVVISLIGGTVLGLLIALLVLPFVTLTQDASEVVPGVIVMVPWRTVLLLELITVVALAIVVGVLALLLRRVGLGNVLRLGEE